jgi:hypothetical protein
LFNYSSNGMAPVDYDLATSMADFSYPEMRQPIGRKDSIREGFSTCRPPRKLLSELAFITIELQRDSVRRNLFPQIFLINLSAFYQALDYPIGATSN